jgi:Protein of unknown function (DUF4007)
MRIGGHQTFHLRESWLFKGLTALAIDPKAFAHDTAAERLGVGKNMAEAIAYWLQACQLVTRGEGLELTPIAKTILKFDPYLELDGTILLIQYLLASNEEYATAWYWFFNKLGVTEFDTETLGIYLETYVEKAGGRKVPETTLQREIACLLSTYRRPEYSARETPETVNPSPFARFGLIQGLQGGRYQRRPVEPSRISPQVFAYLLYRYWSDVLHKPSSMTFDLITKGDKSPALALGLNEEQTAQILDNISKSANRAYLSFNRTGGYSIVNIDESTAKNALNDYYTANKSLLGGK